MDVEACFSERYAEAREKFMTEAEAAGAEICTYENPNPGPRGEILATDVAVIGNSGASKLLIINSATHGVEGYCGSGIQLGILRSGLYERIQDGVLLVLCHALNPHGFALDRRVTEDNVDLNRNFINFDFPLDNPGYAEVHDLLLPEEWQGPGRVSADLALKAYTEEHGMAATQAVVTQGQHSHPDGLFYSGRGPTWSHRVWREVLRGFSDKRSHVALIDLHTGLGPEGYGEPISARQCYERARAWYGPDVTCPEIGASASTRLSGVMSGALREELSEVEATSITLEFGTQPFVDVLNALRGDHWLHRMGDPEHPLAAEIRLKMREAFYVQKPEWKQQVWTRGEEIVRNTIHGLTNA